MVVLDILKHKLGIIAVLALASILCFAGIPLAAQSTANWQTGFGNWSVAPNWNCGSGFPGGCVPNAGISTTIADGGTAVIGGAVASGGTFIGGAGGAVIVTGPSSVWNSGFIEVGSGGPGALTIQSGGVVNSFNGGGGGFVGVFGGTGTVTVTDAGSQWNLPFLEIGGGTTSAGNGTLNVQNGAQLSNSGDLFVGQSGNGTLAISNGGQVTNLNATLGVSAGSSGAVTVDGVGSQWTSSATVHIGAQGSGALTISNSGAVASGGTFIGGAGGAVIVTGPSSVWNSGFIEVGSGGPGALTIQSGGVVNSFNGGGGGICRSLRRYRDGNCD